MPRSARRNAAHALALGRRLRHNVLGGRSATGKLLSALAYANRAVVEPAPCPPRWRTGPPDFVGLGGGRTGTSWWYELLVDHPRVERVAGTRRRLRPWEPSGPAGSVPAVTLSPLRKELNFFDPFAERELAASDVELYHRFFPRPDGSIAGEWTPPYLSDFWTPELLARAAPAARLLVLLRDPVERIRSSIGLHVGAGLLPRDSRLFLDAWTVERDRGRYHAHLSRLLRHFPREQLLVLQYERCRTDPAGELRRTYAFLGVEPVDHRPKGLAAGGGGRTNPSLRDTVGRQLVAELEDDVRALAAEFPEVDLELWPSFRRS